MFTKKHYHNHMKATFEDWTSFDKKMDLYTMALEVYHSLKSEEGGLTEDMMMLTMMDEEARLNYRMALAEQGKEFTPMQVDYLCESIRLALTSYNLEGGA